MFETYLENMEKKMSDEDEIEIMIQMNDDLKQRMKGTEERVRDEIAKLIAIDPRSAYPYMSKQEFKKMMEKRQK